MPLSELDAVIDCPPISAVPSAPPWLMGIAVFRGGLLSVVDLATACGDTISVERHSGKRLLLVETSGHRIAFSVDAILSQVVDAPSVDGESIALRALAARLLDTATGDTRKSYGEQPAP